jgi:selenocysteine lyase/cysteine desulfurase
VFVGPYEHHSNLLPWRHCDVDLEMIPLDGSGQLDVTALTAALERTSDRPLRIGSFSAGSNVTGVATDVDAITELLHRHGALSLWDYAAAGPYVPIDMNPADRPLAAKDAIFLSPHKFIGGPGTPGLLVLKDRIARVTTPTQPGGGTVDFVNMKDSLYSDSLTHREEAGTPAILESIRCGLVFQLKDRVGGSTIHAREQQFVRGAIDAWSRNPAIDVLGPADADRLGIVSFMVRHGRGYLHYNFVVALLNDLFGIQARGGCSCAGPYGATLLGLDEAVGDAFLDLVSQGCGSLKPGWARVNFNYFIDPAEYAFVVQAVNLIAVYGYRLLPDYQLDIATGLWTHREGSPYAPTDLSDLRVEPTGVTLPAPPPELDDPAYEATLAEARRILVAGATKTPAADEAFEAHAETWRWFPLPHEVAAWLEHQGAAQTAAAFTPPAAR